MGESQDLHVVMPVMLSSPRLLFFAFVHGRVVMLRAITVNMGFAPFANTTVTTKRKDSTFPLAAVNAPW